MVENPKKAWGDAKPSVFDTPLTPMLKVAKVMESGAKKYGHFNWRQTNIASSTYISAIFRHLADWADGVDIDAESGQSHLAHIVACCLIVLDSQAHGCLTDDR